MGDLEVLHRFHLGEKLAEMIIDHPRLGGDARGRGVAFHGPQSFVSIGDHREHEIELLDGVTKGQQVRIGAKGLRVDLDWFGPLDPLENFNQIMGSSAVVLEGRLTMFSKVVGQPKVGSLNLVKKF